MSATSPTGPATRPAARRRARLRATHAGVLLAALSIVTPRVPVAAPDAGGLDEPTAVFVLGNLQFLLAHEMAHLVIGELGVPVLGPEENAADYLAATALIRAGRRTDAAARSGAWLIAAADAQRLSWERGTELGAPVPYWDSHALTIQRFFQIACLLYGADPVTYAGLPARAGMPPGRAAGCEAEFRRADRAVSWLVSSYGRKPGEPAGASIAVRYEAPPTRVSQQALAEMRRIGLVESVAARVEELFALPGPATIVVRRCGRAEAAWQPTRRELVVCYELVDLFERMSRERSRDRAR